MRNTCLPLYLVLSLIGTSLGGEGRITNQRVVTRKQTEAAAFKSAMSFGNADHGIPFLTKPSHVSPRTGTTRRPTSPIGHAIQVRYVQEEEVRQEVEEEGCGLSQASRGLAL